MIQMKDNIADYDAVIVKRLLDAGGLFLGKTNTPEVVTTVARITICMVPPIILGNMGIPPVGRLGVQLQLSLQRSDLLQKEVTALDPYVFRRQCAG